MLLGAKQRILQPSRAEDAIRAQKSLVNVLDVHLNVIYACKLGFSKLDHAKMQQKVLECIVLIS